VQVVTEPSQQLGEDLFLLGGEDTGQDLVDMGDVVRDGPVHELFAFGRQDGERPPAVLGADRVSPLGERLA